MYREFVFGVALVAACGGESPDATTAASARPRPTTAAIDSAAPTASATQSVAPSSTFTLAPPVTLPADLPKLADVDSPAINARKYGGAVVSVAARVRALADLDAKWSKDFKSLARGDREKAAVAWLSARPEIEAAGASSTGVWARFKDGKMIVAPTYSWPMPARKHASREQLRDSANAKTEIPQSKSRSMPDWFGYDTNASIGSWLGAHGYTEAGSDLAVDALRTEMKNVGVLYVNTHGALGSERDLGQATGSRNFNDVYSLLSATPVVDGSGKPITSNSASGAQLGDAHNKRPNDSAALEDDLAHGRLVYFYAPVGDGAAEWHYGFTFRFVAKYFTFADDSFVFLNACDSASPDAALMTSAFNSKNASVIAGWDHEVSPPTAMRAAEFIFDRLLGANKMSNWGLTADKPKQRPWNIANTFGDLKSKGYDHETNPKGEPCAFKYVGDTSNALIPIVAKMEVDELKQEMTIHGELGDDPASKDRRVTIGGVDCPVSDWSNEKITCKIPDAAAGDVIAERLGRKSNPAPLTTWKIKVRHKTELQVPGAMTNFIDFLGDVRVDMHPTRESPADQPKPRDPVSFYVARDSTCKGAGGSGKIASGGGTATYGAGQAIPVMFQRPSGNSWCTMYGQIDPANKKLRMAIFAVTSQGAGTINAVDRGVGFGHAFGGAVVPVPGLFDGSVSPPPGMNAPAMATALDFPLDDKGVIAAGKRGPVDFANGHAKISIEYDAVTPADYPTDDTPQ